MTDFYVIISGYSAIVENPDEVPLPFTIGSSDCMCMLV